MNIIVINFNCRIDILTNCNTQIKKKKKGNLLWIHMDYEINECIFIYNIF